jgi:hypothetical protein
VVRDERSRGHDSDGDDGGTDERHGSSLRAAF